MFPPWMIDSTLTVPQLYAIFGRRQTAGMSPEAAAALANQMRAKKGLPPLSKNMPSSVKVIDPEKRRPKVKHKAG